MRLYLRRLGVLGLLFVAAAMVACAGDGATTTGSGVPVVATTTQIGALVRAVAGDDVQLTVLLPAGADAHDYEPNPQALRRVHNAKVVFRNGLGLDDWLDGAVKGAGGHARVITVTEGARLNFSPAGDPDPHVWHDIDNVKVMLAAITSALEGADPGNAASFETRADAYSVKLDETDAEIRALIAEIPEANRKVVTNHDAFGYFLQRYGLRFVAAVIPSANKQAQASGKDLARLQETIARAGVHVIFAEAEVDPKVARELAGDIGVRIVTGLYADSLGPPGSGADTIDGMLLSNARKIAEALR